MKPEFYLQDVWDGWQSVRSPDNVTFVIEISGDEMFEVFASILELVELYKQVRAKQECDTMIGTGTIIQIEDNGGQALFRLDETHEAMTTYEYLECVTEDILREVFTVVTGDPSRMPSYEYDAYPCIEEIYRDIVDEGS